MNTGMLAAFVGVTEIFVILLVLLVMVGLAVAFALFLAWLLRRRPNSESGPPGNRPNPQGGGGPASKLSFVAVTDGRPRVRWDVYFLGLGAAIVITLLLNGLLLATGVWSGVDTVLAGLVTLVVVFNILVLRDFNRAGRNPPPNNSSPGAVPAGDASAANSSVRAPQTPGRRCPRCGAALAPNSPHDLCPRCVLGVGLATPTDAGEGIGPNVTRIVKPPVPSREDVARRFPQLEILECLGCGGMGVVYRARQPKLNRLVALKILAPEKGADPKFAERFLREAQALARLNHPNIVTVHDFGEADGMFFLLMEFVDGMTLRQLLREGRIKPEEALAIVPPICEALQFAHEQGIVHRDIKPENVLLDKQGRVKIADFGIAKLVGTEQALRPALTEERSVIGTPHYMAPEQVERPGLVDHRADIYSLGVVFYEMLTGELPLGKFLPPSKKVQVDVRLDEVVLHALEKEPDRRYQHASEVKTDVETIRRSPADQETRPITSSGSARA